MSERQFYLVIAVIAFAFLAWSVFDTFLFIETISTLELS